MALLSAKLEALLFIYGDPLDTKKAAKMLACQAAQLAEAVQVLRAELSTDGRGLTLVEHDGALQLATKSDFADLLQTVLKAELNEALSAASLETLSIISYAGPIARPEIDYIRGVNSTYTIRALLLRGLIQREADPERANAYRYKPSIELLQHLGVTRVEELPEWERFRTLVAAIKAPAAPSVTESAPKAAQ